MSPFIDCIEKAVEDLQEEENKLIVSNRKDEANLVKIRMNIYNICSTIYQVFENGETDISERYLAKLDDLSKRWETSLAKAREYEDVENAIIEEIKMETLEKIKKCFSDCLE